MILIHQIAPLCFSASKEGCSRPLQSREERGGLGRFRRGGEDRLLVGLQDGKPRREILGVIRARLASDKQIGAAEGGSEFGDLS
jgi:hypothetical protein